MGGVPSLGVGNREDLMNWHWNYILISVFIVMGKEDMRKGILKRKLLDRVSKYFLGRAR